MSPLLIGAALSTLAGGALAQTTPPANPLDAVPEKMPFDIPYGTPISLDRAEAAIAAAVAESKRRDWKMNVAVVDGGGNLVAFQRMDGAQIASVQISQHKLAPRRPSAAKPRSSRAASSPVSTTSSRSTA